MKLETVKAALSLADWARVSASRSLKTIDDLDLDKVSGAGWGCSSGNGHAKCGWGKGF